MPVLARHSEAEVVSMNWIVGYLFDGWNSLRAGVQEIGEAFDRAMDVWDE